ncbi:hypothetical protein NB699_003304 [Xanthomonas sacchari]|nr:hypothetical protein [Xanthomonas sacchari]MCW0441738.1 hypothetical protein [Xanthomonas sacchari]
MRERISIDRAAEILSQSFSPCRCVAEIWDYRQKVRFRIFNHADEPLITLPKLTRAAVNNPQRLAGIIATVRERLRHRGIVLDDWAFPTEQ